MCWSDSTECITSECFDGPQDCICGCRQSQATRERLSVRPMRSRRVSVEESDLRLEHAFYCGQAADDSEILAALRGAVNVAWQVLGNLSKPGRLEVIAYLMAFITANDGIIAVFQGAAKTGPRALAHRSILANTCNPQTRDLINERVKHRELI